MTTGDTDYPLPPEAAIREVLGSGDPLAEGSDDSRAAAAGAFLPESPDTGFSPSSRRASNGGKRFFGAFSLTT